MDLKSIRPGERRANGSDIREEAETRARSEAAKARREAARKGEEMRHEAVQKGEQVRHELGERMFNLLTDAFPKEYRQRRREDMLRGFGAGLVVGIVGREIMRRR